MLHVLLVILKVVGIALLSILLVLLLLLMLVLLVPIRYQAYAGKNTEVYAKVNASWLLHFIHFSFYYDKDGLRQNVRIFGASKEKWKELGQKIKRIFKFSKSGHKRSKDAKKKDSENKKRKSNQTEIQKNLNLTESNRKLEEKPAIEVQDEKTKQESANSKNDTFSNDNTQYKEMKKQKGNKKPFFHVKEWYLKIISKIKELKQKIKSIFEKLIFTCKNAKNKLSEIKALIQDERNKQAFLLCKEQLIITMKHISPKKYKINIKYGTGDPALTGQILGILGMLMPIYKNNAHIVPDFENTVFEGDIYLKGRVTIARILLIGWKLYRDKNVKRCYKIIMD